MDSQRSELETLTWSRDWSRTSLGPVDQWPQSLKTIVDVLLTSRFSMWMGWGPDLVFFYNDAYRRDTIGVKHPWALGRPFREVWSEIWDDLQPRIQSVLSGGGATWDEALLLFLERSGYVEETYHTFSYSALKDDTGRIAGLLSVVTEVTDRVIGERHLALLGDLGTRLSATKTEAEVFEAARGALETNLKDLPFSAMYLFGEDGTTARRVMATGAEPGDEVLPATIRADDERGAWPIGEIVNSKARHVTVDDLASRFPRLPRGAWDEAPTRGAIVPFLQRGQEKPAGFIIVGLNPFRAFDAAYQNFLDLIAGQIASSHANARAYDEERRRAEALAELDRAKTTFFSNVSHEFRTPLTLMLSPLEDLMRKRDLPADVREHAVVAHRNGLRLLKLVNSLLDFSRIEAGRVRASYEPTNLAEVTAELASGFESVLERAGLSLSVDAGPLTQSVYVDRDMWEKVVLNLLSNAFKHTFAGGITVQVRQTEGGAEISVIDTGIGIAPNELPRVFERFHRVANARSRTHEGTGIGLALVQEIVRRHGGTITVDSVYGEGTRFTVRMPFGTGHLPPEQIVQTSAAADGDGHRAGVTREGAAYVEQALRWLPDDGYGFSPADIPADGSAPEGAAPAARILLADDNADMRQYVARLLAAQGWKVDAVPDGAAALEAIRVNRPDVVLSDVMMPRLDGFGLLRALRADPETSTLPIILLSARAGEEARVEGAAAAADDYVVKPFSALELVARVGAQLTLSRERARAEAAVRSARDLLTTVLEQAPVGICVMRGPEHTYELANAYYRRFLPAERRIIGRTVREVVPEAEGQGFITLLDRVRATGEPFIGRDVEIVYDRRGDGSAESAFLNLLYYPFYSSPGVIDGVIAVVSEVTEEVKARRDADLARQDAETARAAADAARQAAEAANRAKSDFLAVMSHELRTPLNAIGGYVDLIEMGIHGPVSDAQRDALERVGRSQRHLLGLINDVLNLARIETGRVDYTIERVELRPVVNELAPMIQPQLGTKRLRYDVHLGDDGLALQGDHDKVVQILLNLLSNAIKFTPDGGRVELRTALDHDAVRVEVRDTGIGIPADKLEAIFEPFVQVRADRARTRDGAGLGLSISRDLARGMGGDLRAESVENEGSTFILTLPLAEN
jgi:signal transduction histidine kinase